MRTRLESFSIRMTEYTPESCLIIFSTATDLSCERCCPWSTVATGALLERFTVLPSRAARRGATMMQRFRGSRSCKHRTLSCLVFRNTSGTSIQASFVRKFTLLSFIVV